MYRLHEVYSTVVYIEIIGEKDPNVCVGLALMVLIDLKMCAYANGQLRGSPLTRRRDTLQEVGVAWVVGVVVRLRTALGCALNFYGRKRKG